MKILFAGLFFILISSTTYSQNPYKKGSVENKLYEFYLSCENQSCNSYVNEVEIIFDNSNDQKTMVAELLYLYFMSISVFYEGNQELAEKLVKKCQSIIRFYERKSTDPFWTQELTRYFEGMEDFDLSKLNSWIIKVRGSKSSENKDNCSVCPNFDYPPRPSSQVVLDQSVFKSCRTLGEVDKVIYNALAELDYEIKYYPVQNGFALVTRVEQIKNDASTMPNAYRYKSSIAPPRSFKEYFSSLIFQQKGYYRIIVFVITDKEFKNKKQSVGKDKAEDWLINGISTLPKTVDKESFTSNHNCTVLVYEYEVTEYDKSTLSGNHTARKHLIMSEIMNGLR